MFGKSLCFTALFVSSLSATAALFDRGNGMIYDDVLDITWLQDANYVATRFAETGGLEGSADGTLSWEDALTWVDQLSYEGYTDWRLASPRLEDPSDICFAKDGSCEFGYNTSVGELSHMFYNNLGNLGFFDVEGNEQAGYGALNTSFVDGDSGETIELLNIQEGYWYGEEFGPLTTSAWAFGYSNGYQHGHPKDIANWSWAVRDGDVSAVSAVPVPAAGWLFISALGALAIRKRQSSPLTS